MSVTTDQIIEDLERERGIKAYLNGLRENDFILNIEQYSDSFRLGYLEMQRLDWEKKRTHSLELELIKASKEACCVHNFGLYEDIESFEDNFDDHEIKVKRHSLRL